MPKVHKRVVQGGGTKKVSYTAPQDINKGDVPVLRGQGAALDWGGLSWDLSSVIGHLSFSKELRWVQLICLAKKFRSTTLSSIRSKRPNAHLKTFQRRPFLPDRWRR